MADRGEKYRGQTTSSMKAHRKTVHKVLWDSGLSSIAGKYLGRLNELYAQGTRFYHHWDTQKFYTAELRIMNDDIRIQLFPADSFYFEFFTTGKPIVTGVNAFSTPSTKAACVGVEVSMFMNSISVSPKIQTGERNYDGTKISQVGRPYQVQLIDEPARFVPSQPPDNVLGRTKYPQVMYGTYAPMHPFTGIYANSATIGFNLEGYFDSWYSGWYSHQTLYALVTYNGGTVAQSQLYYNVPEAATPLNAWNLRDIGFDIPWMFGDGDAQVEIALLNGPSNGAGGTYDWPRSNGIIQIHDDEWGDRQFALSIDAFSQFTVFPTGAIDMPPNGSIQNVDNTQCQSQGPMLPAWAYQMSETFMAYYAANMSGVDPTGNLHFPDIQWKVHPTGLRACAVVHQQIEAIVDNGFVKPSYLTSFNSPNFETMMGQESRDGVATGPGGANYHRYQYGTGLVEVTLSIQLTGPDPADYIFNATVATYRQPTSCKYAALLADYAHMDIANTCSIGELIVVDVERWYRPGPIRAPAQKSSFLTTGGIGTVTCAAGGVAQMSGGGFSPETYMSFWNPWDDTRRVLYSVKNYGDTSNSNFSWDEDIFVEVASYPGMPSGVMDDSVDTSWNSQTATYELFNGFVNTTFGYTNSEPIDADILFPSWHSSIVTAQIMAFDLTTLSFAFKVTTFESCTRLTAVPGDQGNAHKFHQSVAIVTFNNIAKQLFPTTMPASAQAAATSRFTQTFRQTYMQGNGWTLIELGDTTTWGLGGDYDNIRINIALENDILTNATYASTYPVGQAAVDFWMALNTFDTPAIMVLMTTPQFAWNMYSDLVQNSIIKHPWTTFFVHPNGTWAFFDQSIVYNRLGHVFDGDNFSWPLDNSYKGHLNSAKFATPKQFFTDIWNAFTALNPLEHCIFDWVHFEFTLSDGSAKSIDTNFLTLYNNAVLALDPDNVLDTFTQLDPSYSDFKATFTPYFNGYFYSNEAAGGGSAHPDAGYWGFTIAHPMASGNFNVDQTRYLFSPGNGQFGQRWNFFSLARVTSSSYTQAYTFSSCTLIDS